MNDTTHDPPLKWLDNTFKEEKGGGVKGIKRFSVHFTVQTPLQIVFLNIFENCKSPSKMKPCTMTGPEISKKY